ncbi:glycerol-3-phosphate dehydrogenase [Sugiyamaella lignohabitans]|uniref:Glycerol-3-phosphate dehydrogenase n=1 Tax=Sugiyamaella lignohabitans TaxID=796027 RepID=A0A167DSI3_9ASCO|nr:glycerol-3-phosphate dehydrogenase [Sugiyamaella lignohabitans]ANB13241.1 glycerol-3-phosphate dehydrogenase [Sugiyamaella lignohabitans]
MSSTIALKTGVRLVSRSAFRSGAVRTLNRGIGSRSFSSTKSSRNSSNSGSNTAENAGSNIFQLAALTASSVTLGASIFYFLFADEDSTRNEDHDDGAYKPFVPAPQSVPRSRDEILKSLKNTENYDIIIIGGGATGAGVALDAITRGLKVALVERDDYASCTSSRSTKLIHGGVRYLEKAVWHADYEQYKLVKEALHERKVFLDMAPHLSFPLPIMIPLYKWWQMPYYWVGVKCYDLLAGKRNLESSYVLTRGKALEVFPMLNDDKLKGAVVYYDGSHNDSRTNVSVALTAQELGADVINHVEVTGLKKDANGKLIGIEARDLASETPETFSVSGKSVVNATGPFSDTIRKFDNQKVPEIVVPSSGIHIVLPGWYSPKNMGLLDPATSDGRVIFFLPWQGSTIAGTTDAPCEVERNPIPSEKDINFVLKEVKHYIDGKIDVRRDDVQAAWSGVRPLVMDPAKMGEGTQGVVRNHLVTLSDSGLVTIAGGKWTTFRQMAQETVDTCIEQFNLSPVTATSQTEKVKLVGGEGWTPLRYIDLIQKYNLEPEVAQHLSENYGTRAFTVAELCTPSSSPNHPRGKRIVPSYPFIDGELLYAMRYEYATTAVDFLARRTRLAFLNSTAAFEALPSVIDVMAKELNWSKTRKDQEYEQSVEFLKGMGLRQESDKN